MVEGGKTLSDREMGSAVELTANNGRSARLILDATAKLLRTRGYQATTLRDIADAVGIKAGSIYHHFSGKDEIVEAVLTEGVRVVDKAVRTALAALPDDATAEARLQAAITAHLTALLEHGDYTSASIKAFATVPAPVRERSLPARREYEAIWRELVAQLEAENILPKDAPPAALRLMLLGAMNQTPDWYQPGRLSVAELAAAFSAIVTSGRASTA